MLLKNENQIVRLLEERDRRKLIISCAQQSMPVWISECDLEGYIPCDEVELSRDIPNFEDLSPEQKRIAHERYTLIAGVLPFLGDNRLRSEAIARIASSHNVSKQTIRSYLCRYSAYQNLSVLAPQPRKQETPLSRDERNMRWALNKFYYTRQKNSLTTAYMQMLKHK